MIRNNPNGDFPNINDKAYLDPSAVVIGNVIIGENVFIGPGAIIRADEPGSVIKIENNCNIQDRVIIHGLEDTGVLIKENTSIAHGAIIHGPCQIGKNCFIGFGSVIFKAELKDQVCVKHLCCVENVIVDSEKLIDSHNVIKSIQDVENLKKIKDEDKKFMNCVLNANLDLTKGYKKIKESEFLEVLK